MRFGFGRGFDGGQEPVESPFEIKLPEAPIEPPENIDSNYAGVMGVISSYSICDLRDTNVGYFEGHVGISDDRKTLVKIHPPFIDQANRAEVSSYGCAATIPKLIFRSGDKSMYQEICDNLVAHGLLFEASITK